MYPSFSAEPLSEPMTYRAVEEGHYATGHHGEAYDHIATFGLLTCKAIILHRPGTNSGTLAHLDGTVKLERTLSPVIAAWSDNLSDIDVSIVQTLEDSDTFLWPSSESIATQLMKFNPRSIKIDYNSTGKIERNISLRLSDGSIFDVLPESGSLAASKLNPIASTPIRPH